MISGAIGAVTAVGLGLAGGAIAASGETDLQLAFLASTTGLGVYSTVGRPCPRAGLECASRPTASGS